MKMLRFVIYFTVVCVLFSITSIVKPAEYDPSKKVINLSDTLINSDQVYDGPYVSIKKNNEIKITRFVIRNKKLKKETHRFIKDSLSNILFPVCKILIPDKFTRPSTNTNTNEKIIIIGDIHGEYDSLKLFLTHNKVIDASNNWIFGKGHLVFLGDIFDRGEKVTETLWLIFKLEQQAQKLGGNVHLLLGNHELMELDGDTSYLHNKYKIIFQKFGIPYKKLYNKHSILGRWIRSKNCMEILNDNLCLHGGIHPLMVKWNLSADSVNSIIYNYLNYNDTSNPNLKWILGPQGPFWYRGMVEYLNLDTISTDESYTINRYFKTNRIFIGHTELSTIIPAHNKTIYPMDIPFYKHSGKPLEAILIENNILYLLNTRGKTTELH